MKPSSQCFALLLVCLASTFAGCVVVADPNSPSLIWVEKQAQERLKEKQAEMEAEKARADAAELARSELEEKIVAQKNGLASLRAQLEVMLSQASLLQTGIDEAKRANGVSDPTGGSAARTEARLRKAVAEIDNAASSTDDAKTLARRADLLGRLRTEVGSLRTELQLLMERR